MLAGNLISGSNTPGAQIKSNRSPVNRKRRRLNIGHPGSSGMLLGMTDSISETQCFSTHVTFDSQF